MKTALKLGLKVKEKGLLFLKQHKIDDVFAKKRSNISKTFIHKYKFVNQLDVLSSVGCFLFRHHFDLELKVTF